MLVEVRDPEEEVVLSRVSDGAVFQININGCLLSEISQQFPYCCFKSGSCQLLVKVYIHLSRVSDGSYW